MNVSIALTKSNGNLNNYDDNLNEVNVNIDSDLKAKEDEVEGMNLIAFFILGITNNIIYMIFLSAAVDILEGGTISIPKSTVLLADIAPCIVVKLFAPYFLSIIPYSIIVIVCVSADLMALTLVGWPSMTDSSLSNFNLIDQFQRAVAIGGNQIVWLRLLGVLLASASSGLGEAAFLGLTTYYDPKVVVTWSAGTGAAGVLGAAYYLVMASVLDMRLPTIMFVACALPLMMAASYFLLLTSPKMKNQQDHVGETDDIILFTATVEDFQTSDLPSREISHHSSWATPKDDDNTIHDRIGALDEVDVNQTEDIHQAKSLSDHDIGENRGHIVENMIGLDQGADFNISKSSESAGSLDGEERKTFLNTIIRKTRMIKPLLFKYALPLFLVFYAEYTINQSVFFAMFFPLQTTPFRSLKDHYVTYQFVYMTGVFLSRSFGRAIPLQSPWGFAIAQCGMLAILIGICLSTSGALAGYPLVNATLHSIWFIFCLILIEGVLGGLAYVHAFCTMTMEIPASRLEFSMAFTSVADSLGIGLAAITCFWLEPILCSYNPICNAMRSS